MTVPKGMKFIKGNHTYRAGDYVKDELLPDKVKEKFRKVQKSNDEKAAAEKAAAGKKEKIKTGNPVGAKKV